MSLPLHLPESRAHIEHIQSGRKKKAFALAKTVPWYRDRLAGIDGDALDDPAEWQKIPILDKDTLRKFTHAELLEAFCAVPPRSDCRILAFRRIDRTAGFLSAHRGRSALRRAVVGPFVPVHWHRARRPLPHLLSARRASGRPGVGA